MVKEENMKQLKRKIFAFLVAACLICMNIVPAFADTTTDATAPAAADVRQEAQLTASYLMNSIDFSTYADTGEFQETCSLQSVQDMTVLTSLLHILNSLRITLAKMEL